MPWVGPWMIQSTRWQGGLSATERRRRGAAGDLRGPGKDMARSPELRRTEKSGHTVNMISASCATYILFWPVVGHTAEKARLSRLSVITLASSSLRLS